MVLRMKARTIIALSLVPLTLRGVLGFARRYVVRQRRELCHQSMHRVVAAAADQLAPVPNLLRDSAATLEELAAESVMLRGALRQLQSTMRAEIGGRVRYRRQLKYIGDILHHQTAVPLADVMALKMRSVVGDLDALIGALEVGRG